MRVSEIRLAEFRNISSAIVKFSTGINVLEGNNAQGKTNILEAIYVCSTGRSHRTKIDNQLIKFNEKESHIKTFIQKNNLTDKIDVHLKKDEKKGIAVNGIPIKKSGDLFGTLRCVMFSPEDLQLIKSSPGERRRFIDMELCQLSGVYYYNLQQYYKVLKQRNNLLKKVIKNKTLKDSLFPWDNQLASFGEKVIESREEFVSVLNNISSNIHENITNGKENLEVIYKPNVLKEDFFEKLKLSLEKDLYLGSTSIGPHKDDILFYVNNSDVKIYGSQGQQRTVALSTKLAEIEIIKNETGELPILLLDDVLSELDEKRQDFLLSYIEEIQTILTCTGIEDSIKKCNYISSIFNVKNGEINVKK